MVELWRFGVQELRPSDPLAVRLVPKCFWDFRVLMVYRSGREAELGDDHHFEGNWGLHFWDAGRQEIESRKYESTFVNLGPRVSGIDRHVFAESV
jgi:hypothetical protein